MGNVLRLGVYTDTARKVLRLLCAYDLRKRAADGYPCSTRYDCFKWHWLSSGSQDLNGEFVFNRDSLSDFNCFKSAKATTLKNIGEGILRDLKTLCGEAGLTESHCIKYSSGFGSLNMILPDEDLAVDSLDAVCLADFFCGMPTAKLVEKHGQQRVDAVVGVPNDPFKVEQMRLFNEEERRLDAECKAAEERLYAELDEKIAALRDEYRDFALKNTLKFLRLKEELKSKIFG